MARGGWRDWGEWEHTGPRRPAHGIKAQTQRGKFGQTWWAGRWIAALEQLVDAGRLSRGRSYARSGQVVKLGVGPGGVDASVQGSRPTPYTVTMRFRPLSDAEWERVIDAMSAEAIYAARLLSGEMPEDVERAFAAAGAALFPAAAGDLETDCTCPDWSNPCKHVAAVHYLLGERFDADPFLMFELRGRSKDDIVAALRGRRATAAATDVAAGGAAPGDTAGAALPARTPEPTGDPEDEAIPLLADVTDGAAGVDTGAEAFWTAPADPAAVAISFRAPPVDAAPVKLLGPPPFWKGDQDFPTAAEHLYRAIGERARRLALDGR
jgi:uncharacterized Zn finger protein